MILNRNNENNMSFTNMVANFRTVKGRNDYDNY